MDTIEFKPAALASPGMPAAPSRRLWIETVGCQMNVLDSELVVAALRRQGWQLTTSLAYDLGVKVPLYAPHGIPEAWVIDAATRQTRVFRDPSAEGYRLESTVGPEETLQSALLTDDSGAAVSFALARILPPQP